MLESIVPYEIFPNKETELVSRLIIENNWHGLTRDKLLHAACQNTGLCQLIVGSFCRDIKWDWLEHKHKGFLGAT